MLRGRRLWTALAVAALFAGACSKEEPKPAPAEPVRPKVARSPGEELFGQYCRDCHRLNGEGGKFAPDLTGIAARRDAEYLERVIRDPSQSFPGTVMPPHHALTVGQIRQIVQFLTQKP